MPVTPRPSIHSKGSKRISFDNSPSFSTTPPQPSSAQQKVKSSQEVWKSLTLFFLCLSFGKLLNVYSYYSTDFEVHRNWLAITASRNLSQWYVESTSKWTLDYPPLFAWFEYLLSFPARQFDPKMLVVSSLNYASFNTILFQRLTVIFSDIVLLIATLRLCSYLKKSAGYDRAWVAGMLILGDIGLIMVDHIHFQYNGFLLGFLILSITAVLKERYVEAAFWYTTLLHLKHIYMYIGPAYFVFLLRRYCFTCSPQSPIKWGSFSLLRFLRVGLPVIMISVLSLGPFVYLGQLDQLLSRLFPFGERGLCHAYWAPNFWVFYNLADKIGTIAAWKYGYNVTKAAATMTGGLVGPSSHILLPNITPLTCLILSLLTMVPALQCVWTRPSPWMFLRALVLSCYSSFLFGWHVHEKAILMLIIPLSILAVMDKNTARAYLVLSFSGYYSLFPLLFGDAEGPVKVLLLLCFGLFVLKAFPKMHGFHSSNTSLFGLNILESIYVVTLLPVSVYNGYGHSLLGLDEHYPFVPLLNTSLYCSIGVMYSWLKIYKITLKEAFLKGKKKGE